MRSMRKRNTVLTFVIGISLILSPTLSTAKSRSGRRSVTLWWIIFNNPENCVAQPNSVARCGEVDVFGQAYLDSVAAGQPNPSLIAPNSAARLGVLYATGSVTRANREVWMTASIYRSKTQLALPGPNVLDPLGLGVGYENPDAEVHLVVRDHGRRIRGQEISQTTNFLEPACSDPNLEFFAGDNLCADVQFAVFAPNEEGADSVYAFEQPATPVPFAQANLFRNGDALVATFETRVAR